MPATDLSQFKRNKQSRASQAMLKIAGELHEIKKDNQRIYAGLSKLMAKEKLDDFMNINGNYCHYHSLQ